MPIQPTRIGLLLLFFISIIFNGCALVKLKQQVRESMGSAVIVGHVSTSEPPAGPVIVAAYAKHVGKQKIAHYTVLHDSGEYELMVGKGRFYVFAFCDTNRNLIYDAGEPAGQHGEPKAVVVQDAGVVDRIDVVISGSNKPIDWRPGRPIASPKPKKLYSRLAGEIVDLDDERFEEANGRLGYWEPITFFKTFGGNIFFLEPYDPNKIPILFIHGAGGTPKGWNYFVDHLDRTRFQPWFFYYPSGARIRSVSNLLMWKLTNLQLKYQFQKLYITAHSLGGLVARSFIMDFGTAEFPFVKLLITLATPWGGDKMAEYGVKQSPAVVPCWIDLQPEGDFIRSLYRAKMPENISFYMFCGHKGNHNPFRSNNDGNITLSSLLDQRPQAEAEMNYTFDEDHASVIYSKEVVDRYNTIINTHYDQLRSSSQTTVGYVRINFTYDYPDQGSRPWPRLILAAMDQQHETVQITLRPDDSGRVLGPFPCGDYAALIYADNVKTLHQWVSLGIRRQATHALNVVFTPDGTISGYITTAIKPPDRSVGMPSWNKRPGHNDIEVQSVTLTGPGVHRTIHPMVVDDDQWRKMIISRTDFCIKGYLRFHGLTAGAYELVIKAKGYEPYKTQHFVKPGEETAFRYFEMVPEKL